MHFIEIDRWCITSQHNLLFIITSEHVNTVCVRARYTSNLSSNRCSHSFSSCYCGYCCGLYSRSMTRVLRALPQMIVSRLNKVKWQCFIFIIYAKWASNDKTCKRRYLNSLENVFRNIHADAHVLCVCVCVCV